MPHVHRQGRQTGGISSFQEYDARLLPGVRIEFTTTQSRYEVEIKPDEFGKLAELMMGTNPTETLRAFGAAMHDMAEVQFKALAAPETPRRVRM